jgi:AcrR family transcriptional regulator
VDGAPPDRDEGPGRIGLRERKKLATREAIGNAALRLALERGVENVRVHDIAAAAGVSPRTYNNYFSSREEAICALVANSTYRIVDALRARPRDEPLAEALKRALTGHVVRVEPEKQMLRLIWNEPPLRAELLATLSALHGALAAEIAARLGLDAERDVAPHAVAAAYEGTMRTATELWLRPESTASLSALLGEAVAVVTPVAEHLAVRARPAARQRGADRRTAPPAGEPQAGEPRRPVPAHAV